MSTYSLPTIGLNELPAVAPPSGVTPNFINPDSIGGQLVVAGLICLVLMILCVAVRVYTKLFIRHTWSLDDYVCMFAVIGAIGFVATSISMTDDGVGLHEWDFPISSFTPSFLRKLTVVNIIYSPSILMAKLSLLLFYLELFRPSAKLRYFIYFGIVFNVLFYASMTIVFLTLYVPRPKQSLLEVLFSPNAMKGITVGIAQGGVNIGSDFYILCLPIAGVWKLQLPLKQKVGIMGIFLTGLLACFSSVVALYYRTRLERTSDDTYNFVPVLIWLTVELNIGVMCSCLPNFAAFFRHHLPLIKSRMSQITFRRMGPGSSNPSKPSPKSDISKEPSTKDINVTLGSRTDSKGHFRIPEGLFAKENNWTELKDIPNPAESVIKSNETPRDHYECRGCEEPMREGSMQLHSSRELSSTAQIIE